MIQKWRFFATFALRIVLFGYIGSIVFRTILKYHNNNTQMTEAMKLTHQTSVGISSFLQCSHKGGSLNSVLLYIMVYVGKREKVRANRERDGM